MVLLIMRRLFFIICLLSISIFVSAQKVQSHFFGYGFGSMMYHMERAMNQNGYYNDKENNERLHAQNVNFGGKTWSFVDFYYYRNQLYGVCFSESYNTKSEALSTFNMLKGKLKKKYEGIYWDTKPNDLGIKELIADDNIRSMFLNIHYGRSKGGEMYYYVDLCYYENDLWEDSMNESDNEL